MVDEIVKKNLGRLNNVLAFYKLYENDTPRHPIATHVLDYWILTRLDELVTETTNGYQNFRIDAATRPLAGFIDDLSVWYLRRSRDRFKEEGKEKKAALAILRQVLFTLSQLMAPSMPFFAEYLYQAVKESSDEESVHLSAWPTVVPKKFFGKWFGPKSDPIIKDMAVARMFVSQALEARDKAGIKVRQPLT